MKCLLWVLAALPIVLLPLKQAVNLASNSPQSEQEAKSQVEKQAGDTFREGAALFRQETPEAEREAIEKFKRAANLYRSIDESLLETLSILQIGNIYKFLGDYETALKTYTDLLSRNEAAKDELSECRTLETIGLFQSERGQYAKALETMNKAEPLCRSNNDDSGEAKALSTLGSVYHALGQNQKALEVLNESLSIYSRPDANPRDRSIPLMEIGLVYSEIGQKDKAIESLDEVLEIERSDHDQIAEARALSNLGTIYSGIGEEAKALENYNQALSIFSRTGVRSGEAHALLNIGSVFSSLGETKQALDSIQRGLAILRALGETKGEAAALNQMGHVQTVLGENQSALENFQESARLAHSLGDTPSEALALENSATIYLALGQPQKALGTLQQVLPLFHSAGDPDREALTLSNISVVYDQLGDEKQSLDYMNKSLPLFRAANDLSGEATALGNQMRYWEKQNNYSLAVFFGKEAVDRIQQIRKNIETLAKTDRESFLRSNEDFYRELAALLITQGRIPEAQSVLDLLKLEEYSEFTQLRGDAGSAKNPVPLTKTESNSIEEYEHDSAEIASIGQQWTQLQSKTDRTPEEEKHLQELSNSLTVANTRLQTFFSKLYETLGKSSEANARVENIDEQTSGLQGLVSDLGEGTVAIYTLVLQDKCVILVITPATRVAREIPIKKTDLQLEVFTLSRMLSSHRSTEEIQKASQDIYNVLVTPIEKDLAGAKAQTLIWSLDDVLRYVPVAALYDGKQYLVERYRTALITTASIGNLKDAPHVAAWTGLAMGVAKDYEGLGALTAVPNELDSVVRSSTTPGSHGPVPGTIMLDDSFTQASMENALAKHPPLVHIASHYVFHAGDDTKSWLLLGGKDTGGQGYQLTLAAIRDDQRMDFRGVELLTLSGCQTAVGSLGSDGREIDGLGIVAQRKHAKAVVASLWPVDDASVGLLMSNFYKTWISSNGTSKAEALRQAQFSLLHSGANGSSADSDGAAHEDYSNPFYWAPFILIGNWK